MDDMYEGMADTMLGLEGHLVDTIEFVSILPFANFTSDTLNPVAKTVLRLSEGLESVAITLLVFFFFYEFLKKTVMFEFVNWENVVKILLRFIIAKMVVQHCHLILEAIAVVMNGILNLVSEPKTLSTILDDSARDVMMAAFRDADFFGRIFMFLKMGLCWLVMFVIRVAVLFIVYGRFIEIAIYTAIAPIPLATIAGESTSGVAKKFIQSYIGVLLQGVIIVVMCVIYVGVSAGFSSRELGLSHFGDIAQYFICSGVLIFTLAKSGNWAKQIMGA